ncbi:MAG: translation initiation factor IF-1 [Candidatus Paceibacterota bacterium]
MAKKQEEEKKATIIEALPNTMFRIETEDGENRLAYLAGKMKRYHIRVLIGDEVLFHDNPYGGKVRITRRL